MKNSDMPAAPLSLDMNKEIEGGQWYEFHGITKREHFSGMAMQGMISNELLQANPNIGQMDLAREAISYADALLELLGESQ